MVQRIFGNNKFFCKGRFISGPDARSCIATALMICIPAIVFQVEVGSFLASRYSALLPLLTSGLQLASLGFLLATAFSDPGIMPRQKDYTEQYDFRTKSFRTKQPPRYHDLLLRGHPFKLKYCTTCNIYRPPRCTHCSVCENCIERFDHHCPWIGNCIGKRNYWLFYCFVSCTGALNAFVLAASAAHLGVLCAELQDGGKQGAGDALLEAMRKEPLSAALVVYCAAIVWFTVGLCLYHNYLICTNQTTYEQIKGVYSNIANPFHRGILGNYQDVLGSRVRPRYFDPYTGRLLWPSSANDGVRELALGTGAKFPGGGSGESNAAQADEPKGAKAGKAGKDSQANSL